MERHNLSVRPTFLWLSSWKNTDVFVILEGPAHSLMNWKRNRAHTQIIHTPSHTRHATVCCTPPCTHTHTFASMQALMHAVHSLTIFHTHAHIFLRLICGILCLYCGKGNAFHSSMPDHTMQKFLSEGRCKWITCISEDGQKLCFDVCLFSLKPLGRNFCWVFWAKCAHPLKDHAILRICTCFQTSSRGRESKIKTW